MRHRLAFTGVARLGVVLLAVASGRAQVRAQAPGSAAPAPLEFEVASVRPMTYDHTARTHIYNSPRDGNFKAINVTLRALLEVAYQLPETQMFGGPPWAATDKFDLDAKAEALNHYLASQPSEQGREAKRAMLRALLTDRFKLQVHTETRELPIYALVVAKGGSRLVKSAVNGTTVSTGKSKISIQGSDDSLAILAFELAWRLGRPVIDRTGLAGRYELTLTWTPDDNASPQPGEVDGPSLFTAIQEQLGLKLESTKGPVPVLVVDHLEKPTEN